MGSKKKTASQKNSRSASPVKEMAISDLTVKHQKDLENLNLLTQPFRTLKLFSMAMMQYLMRSIAYLLSHRWCMLFSMIAGLALILLVTTDGPHVKHVEEVGRYLQFGLWWVALGVASSIGLGSGLHTFVLYLGPHIALFTIKAMKCGRVDLKMAPYDTIQFQKTPLWLHKDCSEFGPPVFSSSHGTSVPLSSILLQVQLEAVLWGLGTALGELPPYFISRAASLSGSKVEAMEELDASSENNGFIATRLTQMKRWFFSHAQCLNFFTILILASTAVVKVVTRSSAGQRKLAFGDVCHLSKYNFDVIIIKQMCWSCNFDNCVIQHLHEGILCGFQKCIVIIQKLGSNSISSKKVIITGTYRTNILSVYLLSFRFSIVLEVAACGGIYQLISRYIFSNSI